MASSGRFPGVTVTLVGAGARTIALPSSSIIGLCDTFTVLPTVSAKPNMTTIKETDGKAKIEADAAKARETSNSKWSAATSSVEASVTSIGNALRPLTDLAADRLTKVGNSIAKLKAAHRADGAVIA